MLSYVRKIISAYQKMNLAGGGVYKGLYHQSKNSYLRLKMEAVKPIKLEYTNINILDRHIVPDLVANEKKLIEEHGEQEYNKALLLAKLRETHTKALLEHDKEAIPELYSLMSQFYEVYSDSGIITPEKLNFYKIVTYLSKHIETILSQATLKGLSTRLIKSKLGCIVHFSSDLEDFILDDKEEPMLVMNKCIKHIESKDNSDEDY